MKSMVTGWGGFCGYGWLKLERSRVPGLVVFLMIMMLCSSIRKAYAQDSMSYKRLTLEEVFKLAIANSYQLKIIEKNVLNAQQQVEIARSNKLPALVSDLSYGYISNGDSWNPSFGDHRISQIPHQFTAFSVLASQVVFKGGELENSIKRSALQEQVARLSLEKNTEDVKLLVSAKYLDIYRLISQQKVYENNIKLTQNRLKNVLAMQKQGMVTKNDVLRTELIISDLQLALRRTNDDIVILNQQLNMVTGLPESVMLMPDSLLLNDHHTDKVLAGYLSLAENNNQDIRIAEVNNRVAENNIKLIGSDRLPQLSLYARSNLQRPFTSVVPAVDIYANVWQAGISLHYNISSVYQTRKKMRSGEIELAQAKDRAMLDRQNVRLRVNTAFIKYNEAREDLATLTSDVRSAEENYRVVEKKYFNQLALLADMIDATNIKVEAELKVTTAKINVVYTYCQLLHITGIF